ncbi:MAG TPA: hypothetical protein VGD91_22730, partial [Trebonia sp.]
QHGRAVLGLGRHAGSVGVIVAAAVTGTVDNNPAVAAQAASANPQTGNGAETAPLRRHPHR